MNYTITLTGDELMLIGQALGELPNRVSGPLVNKLQAQVDEQEARATKDAEKANRDAVITSLTDEEITALLDKRAKKEGE